MSKVIVSDDVAVADTEVADSPGPGGALAGPAPGERIGRYTVLERLGSGGMGVVVSAYDPELDRRVAIKLVPATGGDEREDSRARLVREARAMAQIRHPNVVSVHEVGEHEGQVYLAMEQVEGGTLRDAVRRADRDPERGWRPILNHFIHAGRGLAAAHAKGIVHRDFKPENVFIDRDGRVLVGDFGLVGAHAAGDSGRGEEAPIRERLTRADIVVGTPAYMAPEQHTGEPVDAKADQFAFCVALFEALYGALPFAGENRGAYVRAIVSGEIREPPAGRKLPSWLRAAIRRGLSVDPAARHPSMDALLGELGADPEGDWKRGRRERTIASGVGAGFIVAWAAVMLGLDIDLTYGIHFAQNTSFLVVMIAIAWIGRRTFARTAFNRNTVGFGLMGGVAAVLLPAGSYALGITPHALGVLHLIMFGALMGSATATLDARLAGAAAVYLAGFLVAAVWPASFLVVLFLGHMTAAISMVVVLTRRRRDAD